MAALRANQSMFRAVFAASFTLVTAVLVVALTASVAAGLAADGLVVSSSTTFTPDPANERIDVVAQYTLSNVQADEVIGDSVRSYYFTKWVVALPANVTDFVASARGQRLTTTIEADPDTDGVVFASIALPFNLNYQQSVTIDASYTIPGGDPRAEGAVARVNNSFLSFSVWAAGDPGQTDVRINIPAGFGMDLRGDLEGLTRVTRDGATFYEAVDIADPRSFFGRVFGRNDSGLRPDTASLPDDATAIVRAWPDDPDWAEFVVDAIEDDVPVIEDLIGLPWPAGDIEVIETVTPYLYGYAGWFNADSGLIEVGEMLERDLILHELAHAWFNDTLIDGRWITEGLAEEFASQAIAATGDPRPDPDPPELDDPLRVQLSQWASPWSLTEEDAFAYERYHYNASWWVIRQITDDIGLDAFSDVLVALDSDAIAFAGEGQLEKTVLSTRWSHLFDLLENQAGAEGLDELFGTYVLTEKEAEQLETRREVLARYDRLLALAGSWGPPFAIRRELSAWDFDAANRRITEATEVIELRDQLDILAADLGVTIVHQGEADYENAETAGDLGVARQLEQKQLDELATLAEDRRTLEQFADELGVTLEHPPAPFAQAVTTQRELRVALDDLDARRIQTEAQAAALNLTTPAWPPLTGYDSLAAGVALADARLATLDGIERAQTTREEPRGSTARIGLWGTSTSAPLDRARAAYEADELDDALAAVSDLEMKIANAESTGRRRLVGAAAIVAVVLVASLALRRRRYTRSPRSRSTPPVAQPVK